MRFHDGAILADTDPKTNHISVRSETLVRCKFCKNYDPITGDCSEICHLVGDDDYCSFGVFKEDEDENALEI